MASQSISALLAANAELRPLSERLLQIKRLQKRYRTVAPESLAQASRVCAIDGTTVVICANSGPVAAALRHLAPRLLEALRGPRRNSKHTMDQDFTSIRIEVQVDRPAPRRPVLARGELPREKLAGLADRLSDSPLKERLREMAGGDQISRKTRSKR
jgi:Dna[CI] antecedent, DciA